MSALIQSKLTPAAATLTMLGAKRIGGEEAARYGIVDAAVSEDQVLTQAIELARAQSAKLGSTLSTIKRRMYAAALLTLEDPEANVLLAGG
jgi:enoyl-CoA hydratase/carnithine racemase